MKPTARVQAYYSECLKVNLPGALRKLGRRGRDSFSRKVHARFVAKCEKLEPRCRDPLVKNLVAAYREYYREALLRPALLKAFDTALESRVRELAASYGVSRAASLSWDKLELTLKEELRRRGFHALFGRVAPFRSLLVWSSQRAEWFRVKLASGVQPVKVVFLDRFVELGWMHFATFGRHYVGGWAKKDALYCVAQAYQRDFGSEKFRVSYLTHEAQHLSDYRSFHGLNAADLELRAKLAELIASARPALLLKKFAAEARNDPSLPHCLAAYRVMTSLGKERRAAKIRVLAASALAAHTASL
jgi:hypothetical protein